MPGQQRVIRIMQFAMFCILAGCVEPGTDGGNDQSMGSVSYLKPEGLHQNPAFSQVVVATGNTRTVYVGGQNSVDASGAIVGQGDIAAQAEQVATNIGIALAAAGAEKLHVVKLTVYVVQGHQLAQAMQAFASVWGAPHYPPAISVLFVSALAHPDFLLEVDAIAVVPEEA